MTKRNTIFRNEWGELRPGWSLLLGLFGIAASIVVITLLVVSLDRISCLKRGDAMDRPTRWGFWEGCMFQTADGKWVPDEVFRVAEEGE